MKLLLSNTFLKYGTLVFILQMLVVSDVSGRNEFDRDDVDEEIGTPRRLIIPDNDYRDENLFDYYVTRTPIHYTREPPIHHTREPPIQHTREPPVHHTREPPIHHTREPPIHHTREPPIHHTREPPTHHTREPPNIMIDNSPPVTRQPPLGIDHPHNNPKPISDNNQKPTTQYVSFSVTKRNTSVSILKKALDKTVSIFGLLGKKLVTLEVDASANVFTRSKSPQDEKMYSDASTLFHKIAEKLNQAMTRLAKSVEERNIQLMKTIEKMENDISTRAGGNDDKEAYIKNTERIVYTTITVISKMVRVMQTTNDELTQSTPKYHN